MQANPLDIVMVDASLFTPPYDSALCHALGERGNRVLLVGRPPRADDPPLGSGFEFEPLMYRRAEKLKASGFSGKRFLALKGIEHITGSMRLLRLIRKRQPDVVHFQWTALPALDEGLIALVRRTAPVVLTVHDVNLFHGGATSRLQLMRWGAVARKVDALVVHTRDSRAQLVEAGLPAKRIHVIPHGLLAPVVANESPAARPDDGLFRLLMFGQLQQYKGADVLIDAVAQLPEALRQRVRVIIAGRPKIPTEPLIEQAARLGVSDLVDFRFGFVADEDVAPTFQTADACIFPYRDIDASGALMMALHFAKPIIASRLGAFAELLEDGRSGLLVPQDDPSALAEALARLIDEPGLAATLAEGATWLADNVAAWPAIAEKTEALYRELRARH